MNATLQSLTLSIDVAQNALAAGDLAAAESICAQLLGREPSDWRVWALLTETALLRRRPDAALVSAGRAVALAPSNPIALVLLAKCLFVTGKTPEACKAAEHAARHLGDQAKALDAVGAMFALLGFQQRARELFRRAVALRPDVPQYLFNLASAERMIGALADAEAHCDAAVARDVHYGLAHYLRSDLRIQTPDRNHIAEMEALLDDERLSAPSEVLLRFALGKECEDLELYDRAFDHVEAGCKLQRRSQVQDPAAERANLEAIMRAHTRDWIEAAPRGHASAAPVIVAGLPRTGTTLVERIIGSHPAMHSVGETGAFAAEMRRAVAEQPDGRELERIGRGYIAAATTRRVPPDVRFIDKTLDNYLYCGLIHAALPNARIILVQRQPMDACWAILKAHFRDKFSFAYDQVELADYYLAYRRLTRHWRDVLPPDALMEINYEDIVKDQEAASRAIVGFLGLPWDDAVMRFHESKAPSATASAVQVRRPIYASSVGKWRHHAARLAPLRERLAREIAEAELV